MSENFKRLRKNAHLKAVLKAILTSLAAACTVSGVMLFLTTHKIIDIALFYSTVAGGGALIVSFIAAYLILRRSDASIARALDAQYGLNERVQTMLQYKDDQGAIHELQREDTDTALGGVRAAGFDIKRLWIYIVAAVVGVLILTASIILIPKDDPADNQVPDESFSITADQILAVELLIKEVAESDMESPYRENIALALSEMLTELKAAEVMSERNAALDKTNSYILEQIDDSSSAVEIINALSRSSSSAVRKLAEAINYYEWKTNEEWDSYSNKLAEMRSMLSHADEKLESPNTQKMADDTRDLLSTVASEILSALSRSAVSSSDKLYVALLSFAQLNDESLAYCGLGAIPALYPSAQYSELGVRIDESFAGSRIELFGALEVLEKNTEVGENALNRIASIFGYKLPKFDKPRMNNDEEETDSSTGDGSGNGAIGEGTVYGSDELVLDPFTGEYVEYGTLIDRYYRIMFNKLQGDYYTDDEKAALEKYFEILYGGFDEK